MPRTPIVNVEAYVASVGTKCPVCSTDSQSEPFKYGSTEYDGAEVSQYVECGYCGSSWLDVYVLNRYARLVMGDDPDAGLTAEQLQGKYAGLDGSWGEHPRFARSAWTSEVVDEETQRGYWDWVAAHIEQENDQ